MCTYRTTRLCKTQRSLNTGDGCCNLVRREESYDNPLHSRICCCPCNLGFLPKAAFEATSKTRVRQTEGRHLSRTACCRMAVHAVLKTVDTNYQPANAAFTPNCCEIVPFVIATIHPVTRGTSSPAIAYHTWTSTGSSWSKIRIETNHGGGTAWRLLCADGTIWLT